MKKILVFALLFLLILPARAAEADVHALQRDELGLEGVEDAAEGYMDGFTPEDMDLDGGLAGVLEQGESALPGVLRQGVRSCALLLAVVLLCSLADGLSPAAGESGLSVVPLAGALAVAAVAVLHCWRGNVLLSIAGGTALYMLLVQAVFA